MSNEIKNILFPQEVAAVGKNMQSDKMLLDEKMDVFRNYGENIILSYKGSALESLIGTIITEDEHITEMESKLESLGETIKIHAEDAATVNKMATDAIKHYKRRCSLS